MNTKLRSSEELDQKWYDKPFLYTKRWHPVSFDLQVCSSVGNFRISLRILEDIDYGFTRMTSHVVVRFFLLGLDNG